MIGVCCCTTGAELKADADSGAGADSVAVETGAGTTVDCVLAAGLDETVVAGTGAAMLAVGLLSVGAAGRGSLLSAGLVA